MAVWHSLALRRGLVAASAAFLLSRAVVYGAASLAPLLLPERIYADLPVVPFHTATPRLVDALVRWDSIHYLSIASQGYQVGQGPWDTNTPFPPLYPWAMRLLGGWAGDQGLVYAGLIASNLAFFAALVLLYQQAEPDFGPAAARRSVLYLAVFPTAFFFSALYAESLFLLLVLAFFAALRGERWLLAGALGGLAALTRLPGVLLLAIYLLEYLRAKGVSLRKAGWALLVGGLIPLGTFVFATTVWLAVGDPLFFRHTLVYWSGDSSFPLGQLGATVALLTQGGGRAPGFSLLFPTALSALFATAGIKLASAQAPGYRLWFWLYFALVTFLSFAARAPFYSQIRFLLIAFPAFFVFGEWGHSSLFHRIWVGASLFFLALSTILFAQWYWVA